MGKELPTFVCYLIGAILAIVGVAMWLYTTPTREVSVWSSCNSGTCTKITKDNAGCDKSWNMIGAGRAFGILEVLCFIVVAIIAALRWQMTTVAVALAATSLKYVYWVLAFFGLICSVLAWISYFVIYAEDLCGTGPVKDFTDVKVGPAGPLTFVATVVFLIGMILDCVLDSSNAAVEAAEKTSPDS